MNIHSYILQKIIWITETDAIFFRKSARLLWEIIKWRSLVVLVLILRCIARPKVEESFEIKPLCCLRNSRFRLKHTHSHTYSWPFWQPHRFVYPREGKRKRKRREKMGVGERGWGLRGRFWFSCTAQDVCTPSCKYLPSAVDTPL